MKKVSIEKQEEIKLAKKKISEIILLITVVFIIGAIFTNFTEFKHSLPLGTFLMYLPMFILLISIFILNLKNIKTFKTIIIVILIGIFCLITGNKVFSAMYDLIVGPQEIVLEDAEVIIKKRHQRYGSGSKKLKYLKGETKNNNTKEIYIRGKERENCVKDVLVDSNKVIVYYFKGINELYDIKVSD